LAEEGELAEKGEQLELVGYFVARFFLFFKFVVLSQRSSLSLLISFPSLATKKDSEKRETSIAVQ
jgi:hypothetical protein